MAPSPTAEATLFEDPDRTSPAANIPALLVSSIEIQRKERSQDQPPYLSRPEANP
jgi:hypothetical protein